MLGFFAFIGFYVLVVGLGMYVLGYLDGRHPGEYSSDYLRDENEMTATGQFYMWCVILWPAALVIGGPFWLMYALYNFAKAKGKARIPQ